MKERCKRVEQLEKEVESLTSQVDGFVTQYKDCVIKENGNSDESNQQILDDELLKNDYCPQNTIPLTMTLIGETGKGKSFISM